VVEVAEQTEKQLPTWGQVRELMNLSVTRRGEWAGSPMPIDGLRLVVEPRYPYQGLNGFRLGPFAGEKQGDEVKVDLRNCWYSSAKKAIVYIWNEAGKVEWAMLPENWPSMRVDMMIKTLGPVGIAWSLEAEQRAMGKLQSMVEEHTFAHYSISGLFLETSKRSGVTYVFRRLRPTIALRPQAERMRILATLCLHPIGYYAESFCGVMTPTDDVIAHLVMMRGDEHRFWKHSNQHQPWAMNSGI
jgi:hypothetical protein